MNKTIYSIGALFIFSLLTLNKYLFFNVPKCQWKNVSGYKLLLVGDPQIEGDSKISREPYTGPIDLWFNSKYLGFIYGTAIERLKPTYSVILGDLFSSQWINDSEFEKRVERFQKMFPEQNDKFTTIYLPGNHDIGYGSDMTKHRVDRFKQSFGEVNYWFLLRDEFDIEHHRVVILNSMNLDSSSDKNLRRETWEFLKSVIDEQEKNPIPLILLTHVPLHKNVQWCVDKPMTDTDGSGHIIEQNMLSSEVSTYILTQLKPSIIVTGHDHHGCSSLHLVELSPQTSMNDNSTNPDIEAEELEMNEEDSRTSSSENKLENPLQEPSIAESEPHAQYTESQVDAEESVSTQNFIDSTEEYVDSDSSLGNILETLQEDSTSAMEHETLSAEEQESVASEQEIPTEVEEDDGVPDLTTDVAYNITTIAYTHSEHLHNMEKNLTSVTLELTIRSIMGDYGGNLGLLELYKTSAGVWDYHYLDCPYFDHLFIRIVCITNLVTLLVVLGLVIYSGLGIFLPRTKKVKTM